MRGWRRGAGTLWLLYFALRNVARAGYYLWAIPPEWGEAGLHGPWGYLAGAALFWAAAFAGGALLWWRRGSPMGAPLLGLMALYQAHVWAHRLLLERSPFVAETHGFALAVSLVTLAVTAGLIRPERSRPRLGPGRSEAQRHRFPPGRGNG